MQAQHISAQAQGPEGQIIFQAHGVQQRLKDESVKSHVPHMYRYIGIQHSDAQVN
jgi:hypothetical protein